MDAIARAQQRIEDAAAGRTDPAAFDATLERARHAVESLAATTARFESGLPEAIQDGLRQHFRPSARHLAEMRGLTNQTIRRLERIEGDLLADRHARVDDLALLVDLIASGWRSVEERLAKLDARRFALLREEVDMRALCERAYTTFAEEARARGIEYDLELGGGAVLITDGDRVLQIVTNLLSNALRWTPEGGRVDLGLSAQNGEVAVAVSDTGPGIEPDSVERIFRPFWSGDGGGTGLGLAIARELAFALGGRLELHSKPGRGSRFVLVLPTRVSQPAA